jgi:hypothetical protein
VVYVLYRHIGLQRVGRIWKGVVMTESHERSVGLAPLSTVDCKATGVTVAVRDEADCGMKKH